MKDPRPDYRLQAALLLPLLLLLLPSQAAAQANAYLEPSLSVFQGYDDNLFYTFDNEEGDRITRVTPALEAGYESERLNWLASYRFDAETYDNNPVLDSLLVRRFADAGIDYRPVPRLTLSATANYTKTKTPLDLSLNAAGGVQGLLIGRVAAERQVVHPAISYRFTEASTGTLGYTLTQDTLAGGLGNDINMVELEVASILSPTNTLNYGYIYRQYDFNNLSAEDSQRQELRNQESQTPWAGLSHAFTQRVRLDMRAGPRIYDDSVEPYALFTLARTHESGELALSYENNESTLLGELGKVDTETLSGSLVHRFGNNFDLQLVPAYAEVNQDAFAVEIYRLGLNARYTLNTIVSFTLSYDYNYQRVQFIGGDVNTVARNVLMLGITFLLPGRNRTRQTVASVR